MPDIFELDNEEPTAPFAPIVSLEEYKIAESITSTDNDATIEQMLAQVSAAIRRLTGRDFGATPIVEERVFEYRGGGVLDIDDCNAIVSVTMDGRGLAQNRDYRPQGDSEGPYFYLDIYNDPGSLTGSPLMGFTRNEDTYSGPRPTPAPVLVTVEGEFGWTPVPEDVKLAAIEMVRAVADLPTDKLQSESIAEYGYTNVSDQFNGGRWPALAVDLLYPYKRVHM